MQRRTFFSAITALPITHTIPRVTAPPLPVEENDAWWWGFVKRAIAFPPQYCTDKFLDTAVKRSHLTHTSDEEAKRVLRAAFRGAYERSDIPTNDFPGYGRGDRPVVTQQFLIGLIVACRRHDLTYQPLIPRVTGA